MSCVEIVPVCKSAGSKEAFAFNWAVHLARRRLPNHPFAADVPVRPATKEGQTGLEYASSGGVTSGRENVKMPATLEAGRNTLQDGSILWTAQEITLASLVERIATAEWSAPTDLTLTNEAIADQAAYQGTLVTIEGGVPGRVYDVEVSIVTTLGNEYEAILRVTVQ